MEEFKKYRDIIEEHGTGGRRDNENQVVGKAEKYEMRLVNNRRRCSC